MIAGKKALSVLFYVLAAVGAIAIVLLLCAFIAIWMLAETLVRNSAAGMSAMPMPGPDRNIFLYISHTDRPSVI